MRPRILERACHKITKLGKTFGKWIIEGFEALGHYGPW